MAEVALSPPRRSAFAVIFGWQRLTVALGMGAALGLLLGLVWTSGPLSILQRTLILALVANAVFGLFEHLPTRLPKWLARWALQVAAVGLAMPLTTAAIYVFSTSQGAPPFWMERERLEGFALLIVARSRVPESSAPRRPRRHRDPSRSVAPRP